MGRHPSAKHLQRQHALVDASNSRPRFLFGMVTGTVVAGKSIVSDVCGKDHDTVGMGVVTGEVL